MADVHVVPIDDLKPHADSRHCSCLPKIEAASGGFVIIHNSWDGREIAERAIDHAFGEGRN